MEYKKTKLSLISNTLFLSFSIFLLTFIWINFYTRNLSLSLFLGFVFTIIFTIFYIVFLSNKINKEKTNKSLTQHYETIKNHLLLSKYDDIKNLIFSLYNITELHQISPNHYTSKNKDIFLFYENEILEKQSLITILKNRTSQAIDIYCVNYNINIEIENVTINYITIDDIIDKINRLQIEIQNLTQYKNKHKIKLIDILHIILNKQRSKNYLFYGFLLIFTSLFTPFTIYYSIFGTILISVSLYSRFNYRFNK